MWTIQNPQSDTLDRLRSLSANSTLIRKQTGFSADFTFSTKAAKVEVQQLPNSAAATLYVHYFEPSALVQSISGYTRIQNLADAAPNTYFATNEDVYLYSTSETISPPTVTYKSSFSYPIPSYPSELLRIDVSEYAPDTVTALESGGIQFSAASSPAAIGYWLQDASLLLLRLSDKYELPPVPTFTLTYTS